MHQSVNMLEVFSKSIIFELIIIVMIGTNECNEFQIDLFKYKEICYTTHIEKSCRYNYANKDDAI